MTINQLRDAYLSAVRKKSIRQIAECTVKLKVTLRSLQTQSYVLTPQEKEALQQLRRIHAAAFELVKEQRDITKQKLSQHQDYRQRAKAYKMTAAVEGHD